MIFLSPRNRYLLVEEKHVTVSKQEQDRGFVLPTNYKEKIEPYKIMRVVEDSNGKYEPESLVLVPTNVLEEVTLNNEKFYLVVDNYVIAVVQETED
jgi:hypothetical protein